MAEDQSPSPNTGGTVQDTLARVTELLRRHRLVEGLVQRQDMPRHDLVETLVHKQNLAELQQILDHLHPADVAYILESLPRDERLLVWDLVKAERDGEILIEVSDAVRETLIASMDSDELLAAAENLDADEIADLAPDLPGDVVSELLRSMEADERSRLQSALSYEEGTVGALMDFEMVAIRNDVSLEVVLRYLRRRDDLPDQTDTLFVVDRDDILRGTLSLRRLLVKDPERIVGEVMREVGVVFRPDDPAREAASAFERYELVSAPVVDADGRLIGRLTVNDVVDFIRAESEAERLGQAGLREDEDLFAPVWNSARNRWPWLAVNLLTALFASRVIGAFEGSIEKLAALAALMPIVAGIGGNTGNQTSALIIRALALGQINEANRSRLWRKEAWFALLNGVVWGVALGLIAFALYQNLPLALVMTAAMMLNFLLAAAVGIGIPLTMHRLGRDPALGTSVLLTATTDSGGFFIFLGLATLILL